MVTPYKKIRWSPLILSKKAEKLATELQGKVRPVPNDSNTLHIINENSGIEVWLNNQGQVYDFNPEYGSAPFSQRASFILHVVTDQWKRAQLNLDQKINEPKDSSTYKVAILRLNITQGRFQFVNRIYDTKSITA